MQRRCPLCAREDVSVVVSHSPQHCELVFCLRVSSMHHSSPFLSISLTVNITLRKSRERPVQHCYWAYVLTHFQMGQTTILSTIVITGSRVVMKLILVEMA